MTVTAVVKLKGGVGKTTITNGLAHAAVVQGRSCLVVTTLAGHSTMHLTSFTAGNPPENSFADVRDREVNLPIEEAIIAAKRPENSYLAQRLQ